MGFTVPRDDVAFIVEAADSRWKRVPTVAVFVYGFCEEVPTTPFILCITYISAVSRSDMLRVYENEACL